MNKKQNNNLEKTFQDYFSNFESNPNQTNWENISDELLDQEFKAGLESFEVPTSDEVWDNVISVVAIDQLFNQSFDEYQTTPSPQVWNSISTTIEFDQHFENAFQEYTQQPDPEVWDSISNHKFEAQCRSKLKNLEMKPSDDNWDKIKRAIPVLIPLRAFIPHITRVAAVLLLAVSISIIFTESKIFNKGSNLPIAFNMPPVDMTQDEVVVDVTTNQNVTRSANSNLEVQTSASTTYQNIAQPYKEVSANVVSATNVQPSYTYINRSSIAPTVNSIDKQHTVVPTQERNEKIFNKLNAGFEGGIVSENSMDNRVKSVKVNSISAGSSNNNNIESIVTSLKGEGNSSEFDQIKLNNKLFSLTDNPRAVKMLNYNGLYVSLASQFSNTWIVNPALQARLSKFKTAKYTTDFGGSAGVGIGYRFSSRFAAELAWRRTTLNQTFREFIPGKIYLNNELKTVYNTFQTVGKYTLNRIKSNRRNPITSSMVMGLHYRNLKTASLHAEFEMDKSAYINNELGLTAGLDVDFLLSEWITLNLGARASIGTEMSDLSTLGPDSRYNSEIGLQAAIQYNISQ